MNSFLEKQDIEGDGVKTFMARTGGKRLLKKQIVDKVFPKGYEDMVYVEPFVGAGHVFFYKNPSEKEVINDLDKDIINIFKGFKKYSGDKISNDINGTYTKQEFKNIKESKPTTPYNKFLQLFLRYKLSFFSEGKSFGNPRPINSNYNNTYNERLKHTTILNKSFEKVIKEYDSPNTLFYLDPPYENSDGLYIHDTLPIEDVYNIVKNIKGYFIISYNDSSKAKELFKNYNIIKVKTKYTKGKEGGQHHIKTELIITNY
jgi:DNA adenine methylase